MLSFAIYTKSNVTNPTYIPNTIPQQHHNKVETDSFWRHTMEHFTEAEQWGVVVRG